MNFIRYNALFLFFCCVFNCFAQTKHCPSDNQTSQDVLVKVQALTMRQSCNELGSEARMFFDSRQPIVPLKLTIQNNSASVIKLFGDGISLPTVPQEKVKQLLSYNWGNSLKMVAQMAAVISLCCILLGIATFGLVAVIFFAAAQDSLPRIITSVLLYELCVGGIFATSLCALNNMTTTISSVTIQPGQTYERYVFVYHKDYNPNFIVTTFKDGIVLTPINVALALH